MVHSNFKTQLASASQLQSSLDYSLVIGRGLFRPRQQAPISDTLPTVSMVARRKPASVKQGGHRLSQEQLTGGAFHGILDSNGSFLQYWPDFAGSKADSWLRRLQSLPWGQGKVKVFGKDYDEPRLTCYFGEKAYKYSNRIIEPLPWSRSPVLQEIKALVENMTGESFNSVLCNRYRNGEDAMGWHSDNEQVYGPKPTIASVTLGAERDFDLREGKGGGARPRHGHVRCNTRVLAAFLASQESFEG
ncbi:unnamed protein product [Durusdinium trenchii]|uniref:Alpha-ketoglutarate-dependent dioxygenase AlkB-like domain-containing protein n=2 Tax=Durusdinium trenchii TaxID=1381693 RepID=A0ABP0S6I4_9DINO